MPGPFDFGLSGGLAGSYLPRLPAAPVPQAPQGRFLVPAPPLEMALPPPPSIPVDPAAVEAAERQRLRFFPQGDPNASGLPPGPQAPAWTPPISAQLAPAGLAPRAPQFAPPTLGFGSAMKDSGVTPAAVNPTKVETGTPGAPGASGGAPMGQPNPFLDSYNNLLSAQQAALLRPQPQGRFVRPPAPEPLVRMGGLQREGGQIEEALVTGERDVTFRRADRGMDLADERMRGVEEEAKLMAEREAKLAPIRDQLTQIQQEVTAGAIDPDRLWNKASDGKRAGFMIGAIMAGLGQSMAGRGGQPNAAMQSLFTLMDRDNSAQQLAQQARGQKANDLAQLYKQTLDLTGSQQAGVHAANLAKLDAMERQFEAEYEQLRARMPVGGAKRDPLTGQPVETSILDLRKDAAINQIRQRRAQEDLALQQQIAAATKPVGVGGGGNNRAKLLGQIADLEKKKLDAANEAAKAGREANKDQPHAVFAGGSKLAVDPNAPKEAAFEAQKKINMAEMGLSTIDQMEKRLKDAPAAGLVEKGARLVGADRVANLFADEARLLGTDQVTGLASQLSGAGVPSETQARLFQQIMAGGPGGLAALGEARRILNQGKQVTIRNLGVK